MLEIEKVKKKFESDSLAEMIKEYERDFSNPPSKKEVPPNPPPDHSGELFPPKGDAKQKRKKS